MARRLTPTLQLLAIAVGILLGISAIGAMGYSFYLDELYPEPPPAEPAPLEAPVEPRAERVVIVVVDALREDIANNPEVMPALDRIAETGRRGISITQPVTMTLLSVLNLGTGKTPGLSWSVHNFEADVFPDESLFYWADARDMPVAFHGDAAWSQLFGPYADRAVTFTDEGFYADFDGALTVKDRTSIDAAREVLDDPDDWPVVVLHLTSTDKVSHKSGALTVDPETGEPTAYAETATATDEVIGELYDSYFQQGDLWLITSDHGATDSGNHGGGEDITRRAPFVVAGAGVVDGDAPVEVSLNSWVATLSLSLGLPVPRTAETAAAYSLFDWTDAEIDAATEAHLERRREFVAGVAKVLGASEALPTTHISASPAGDEIDADEQLSATNSLIRELREHRRWMYGAALGLGALLQLALLILVLRLRNKPITSRKRALAGVGMTVFGWLLVVSVPLIFDHWLFRLVDWLGHANEGAWGFSRAALAVLAVSMLVILAGRALERMTGPRGELLRTMSVWLAFALGVVATSQIVVKWPFGPLREAYLVMFIWLALGGGYVAWRRGWLSRRMWALAAVSTALLVGLSSILPDTNLQLLPENSLSFNAAQTAVAAASAVLGAIAWRRETDPRTRALWAAVVVVAVVGAALYRFMPEPWAAKVALGALAGSLALLLFSGFRGATRRDGLFVVALNLAHVMTSDWVALLTVALLGLIVAIGQLRLPANSKLSAALLASVIGLVDIAFFYVLGYRFSFTEMDTQVVFMLDNTEIDLVAGYILMNLQHSAVWLMFWGAVVCNRMSAGDVAGLRTTFLAVLVVFALRTWGSFFGMEFYQLNHWYISHAVPMFIMELVAASLATFWFGVVAVALRDGWVRPLRLTSSADPGPAPPEPRAALAAGSAAAP